MLPARRNRLTGLLLAVVAACGGNSGGATFDHSMPQDCEAFVTKYEACLTADLPGTPQIAKERATHTREALLAQAQASSETRASIASSCRDNLQRLSLNCRK